MRSKLAKIPINVSIEDQSFENPFDYFMADAQITSKAPVTLRAIQFIEIFQKF